MLAKQLPHVLYLLMVINPNLKLECQWYPCSSKAATMAMHLRPWLAPEMIPGRTDGFAHLLRKPQGISSKSAIRKASALVNICKAHAVLRKIFINGGLAISFVEMICWMVHPTNLVWNPEIPKFASETTICWWWNPYSIINPLSPWPAKRSLCRFLPGDGGDKDLFQLAGAPLGQLLMGHPDKMAINGTW